MFIITCLHTGVTIESSEPERGLSCGLYDSHSRGEFAAFVVEAVGHAIAVAAGGKEEGID